MSRGRVSRQRPRDRRPGCDGCEIRGGGKPAAKGWTVRTMTATVEWWPYGLPVGPPKQLHPGERFTFCGLCSSLMAAGRYRELARRLGRFSELIEATAGVIRPAVRQELDEHAGTLRRIGIGSDVQPWSAVP